MEEPKITQEMILFWNAASTGDITVVKERVKSVPVNSQDRLLRTVLHHAVIGLQPGVVTYLMSEVKDLQVNIPDISNLTPLHLICKRSKKVLNEPLSETAKSTINIITHALLQENRAELDIRDDKERTPLLLAARSNLLQVVAMLLNQGASTRVADLNQRTALHYATINGNKEMIEILIQQGANLEAKDKDGYRAVHLAAYANNVPVVRLLKSKGATMDAMNNWNQTPYDLTKDTEIKWLIEERNTTTTHPFQIDFIQTAVIGKAKIGMSMCPGRNKKNWRRNLEDDISVLVKNGIQTVISLVNHNELDSMGINQFHPRLAELGIEVIHFPIQDKWIPGSMDELIATVAQMKQRVELGRSMLVHCNGGKGRTGLLVVSTLVSLGVDVTEAIMIARQARDGMIKNPAQQLYVRAFKKAWFK